MKSLCVFLLTFLIFLSAHAQYTIKNSSPSLVSSRLPGFSQVTTYNTKTIAYTQSVTPASITPVDGDSTHEFDEINTYGDGLTTAITTADGNITTTTVR